MNARPGRKTRILIADDEPNLRLLYQSELEADGYDVVIAKDGKEAVQKAATEDVDLVVLDIRMPGMDGVEALGQIIDGRRTLPVILNSAYSAEKDNFMTWSADAYVIKSADVGVLKAKIKEVLENRRAERDSAEGGEA